MSKKITPIGYIDSRVIDLLGLELTPNTPIFIGEQNIEHMKDKHPDAFLKYGHKLSEILQKPDYVAKHPKKESIEYIKIFHDHEANEHVLVAVRASKSGVFYARTLFIMTKIKVQKYHDKGALKKYQE